MITSSSASKKRRDVAIFDRSGAVKRPSYSALLREIWSLAAYRPAPPDLPDLPRGHGHVVLVIPAFLMGDMSTEPLRQFLTRCGHRAYGWGLGVNWGPTPRLLEGLRPRLADLNVLENGPVSVVGVSLGGVLARDLAYDRPRDVRQVITVASPIRLPTASTIEPLFRLCSLFHASKIDLARLGEALPVPSTAIFTRDDGIVAWQSCMAEDKRCRAVEVVGQHLTICRNPEVLRVLATQLTDS
jgi:pimeloyl-ACP methyl ester carboxylesterase